MTHDQCHFTSDVDRRFRTWGREWGNCCVPGCSTFTVCPFGLRTIRLVVGIPSELVMRPAPRPVGVINLGLGHKSHPLRRGVEL